ncbi:MAG: hypothetical protein IID37_08540 [Planctomycetes bacterium]|nr:hypothetical protein [Planctomycetota bacterium]
MTGFAQQLVIRPPGPVEILFPTLAVLLCALVFFVVLRLLTSLLGSLGAAVSRLFQGPRAATVEPGTAARTGMRPTKVCSNARCRKANFRTARFCAQCGARM